MVHKSDSVGASKQKNAMGKMISIDYRKGVCPIKSERARRRRFGFPVVPALAFLLVLGLAGCVFSPDQTPPAAGVTSQQFNQRVGDVEKRLKSLEDAAAQTAGKMAPDVKKEIDDLKLRVSLLETRPPPSGLTADERTHLDSLDKRLKALESTPTPTPGPAGKGAPTPIPTPTPTPSASAASVSALEKRVDVLEKEVQQMGRTTTATPAPTPAATPVIDLRVVNQSVSVSSDSKSATVAGEIVNNGTAIASPVTVIVTFYKPDGSVLGYGKGTPAITALPPLQRTPFSFTTTGDFTFYLGKYIVSATTAATSQ